MSLRLAATTLGEVPERRRLRCRAASSTDSGFYRNQKIAGYERNEIPITEHVVVAAEGSKAEVEFRLKDRHVTRIGSFAAQKLDFYLVSGSGEPQSAP